PLAILPCVDGNGRPALGEREADGAADIAGAPGDEGDLACELRAHVRLTFSSTGPPAMMRSTAASMAFALSSAKPPKRQLARYLAMMSSSLSGSCAPPRICGLRTSRTLPSLRRARTWPVKLRG